MSVLEGCSSYYEVLQLPRDASHEQIVRQFRALSMRCNPLRNPTNMQVNQLKFDECCNAYEVLGNVELKAVYDKYGEYGLKEGIVGPDGVKRGGGYFMKRSSQAVFEEEFSAVDPFGYQDRFTEQMNYGSLYGNAQLGQNAKYAEGPKDIDITLDCTLEEFYNGSMKEVKFARDVLKDNARTCAVEEVTQNVEVKPGFSDKTELRYKGDGNQQAGSVNSDLIIRFKSLPHCEYTRVGDNLLITKKVSLFDAIKGVPVGFTALDGRPVSFALDCSITPKTCKPCPNEGMPKADGGRGDLFVKFDIEFPKQFTTENRDTIIGALQANSEEI